MPNAGWLLIRSMIKAAIFDFYGVIQTDEVIIWAEKQLADHPAIRQVVDEASRKIDLDEITLDQYFEKLAAGVDRPVAVVKQELNNEIAINQPLLQIIDELRAAGIKTSVLSNDGSSLRGYIEGHGITRHFDEIFISGELNMMKPDSRIYQHAAQQLGFEPQEIIFFDDRQTNIDGAVRAGMQAELFTSNSQVRNILSSLL